MANCTDCGHDQHEAGECKKCNCGESAVVHRTGYAVSTKLASKRQFRVGCPEDIFLTGTAYRNERAGQE